MTLKAFHVVFIGASVLLAFFFAAWCLDSSPPPDAGRILAGVGAIAAGLAPLDQPTHYLLAGASVALSGSLELEAAAAENVFSPAWGADFTLLLGLRGRP